MRRLHFFGLFGPLAALAVGCGSVGDVERREPIAIISGQLTMANLTSPPSDNLRVAVVWTDGKKYSSADDIAVTPVFPSKFQVHVVDPPPPAAMTPDKDGSGAFFAMGSLVAYEDRNGNGKLDLVDENASSFVDRILGANPDVLLAWFEGLPAGANTDRVGATNGYQFVKITPCADDEGCILEVDYIPITTLYEMMLTDEPKFAQLMCMNGGGDASSSGSFDPAPHVGPGPNGVWPGEDDPNLSCSADRASYTYNECGPAEYDGLCGGSESDCALSTWTYAGETPPARWPCP